MENYEQENSRELIKRAIENSAIKVIGACAPSTRVAMSEMFGVEVGLNEKGRLVTALKKLGFNEVFDLDFGADLTIMEEAAEFAEKFITKTNLPHFTSCCPAWVKYVEKFYPDMAKFLSTTKSPQQIFGAIIKTYYAEKLGVSPENLFVVCIMPCLAKRLERLKTGINVSSGLDVDAVLTVRELGQLLKDENIDFKNLSESDFDKTFGLASGAGVIFGTTGGVLQAALRTIKEKLDKKPLEKLDAYLVKGEGGLTEAEIPLGHGTIKIAIASGLANAKIVLDRIRMGEHFDFVEVMACPGGCVNGTGMPLYPKDVDKTPLVQKRANGLKETDLKSKIRKSHDNSAIQKLYSEFLGHPGSEIAKKLLHVTHNIKRGN